MRKIFNLKIVGSRLVREGIPECQLVSISRQKTSVTMDNQDFANKLHFTVCSYLYAGFSKCYTGGG